MGDPNIILKSNDFSDSFKDITFYIDKKNTNNELINIFIKDESGSLNTIIDEIGEKKNSTIIAEKGFVDNQKLILFNGMIQTVNEKKEIQNILFEKTELSLVNLSTSTIKQPKIQETSSNTLLKCYLNTDDSENIFNCNKDSKKEAVQNLSRRLATPLYIPLISVITSFLLIYKKLETYNFIRKYILFILSFLILILSEIFLKYTGLASSIATSYFIAPLVITFLFYIYLYKKIKT